MNDDEINCEEYVRVYTKIFRKIRGFESGVLISILHAADIKTNILQTSWNDLSRKVGEISPPTLKKYAKLLEEKGLIAIHPINKFSFEIDVSPYYQKGAEL